VATKRNRIGEQRITRRERRRRRATADFLVSCRNPMAKIGRAASELLGARDRALLIDEVFSIKSKYHLTQASNASEATARQIIHVVAVNAFVGVLQ